MKRLVVLGLAFALLAGVFVVQNFGLSASQWGYEDGTYRGVFLDRGEMQVNVQFTLENNEVTNITYRYLKYAGIDYLDTDDETVKGLTEQHEDLIEFLVGRDIREALPKLYDPGEIVDYEVDGFSGATLRAAKVISAIRDGLNRGVYRY